MSRGTRLLIIWAVCGVIAVGIALVILGVIPA
jgi:hypothetical protein